jgi:branched-chain amino acid aminotransferase
MMALQEALNEGYDEALMLDVKGFVSEGSGENIFIVSENTIYTPDLSSALPGITRDTIFTLAAAIGYEIVEKNITCDDIYNADEAFFTGTAAEVTPVRELDDRQIGSGTRGPVTEKLQSLYFDCVHGRNNQYLYWLAKGRCS